MTPDKANCQIVEAFGLEPRRVKSFALVLDKRLGPIATVELYQVNSDGKRFVGDDGEVATVIQQMTFMQTSAE